jgi:hypothetical protein
MPNGKVKNWYSKAPGENLDRSRNVIGGQCAQSLLGEIWMFRFARSKKKVTMGADQLLTVELYIETTAN